MKIKEIGFDPPIIDKSNFSVTSTSSVLGDSNNQNEAIFKYKSVLPTSLDGTGFLSIRIPKWYSIGTKLNMMFNEQARNTCSSEHMRIISSTPSVISSLLSIRYDRLDADKI